ncbi:MAG: glutamine-hydrolyzing carbamoyl-phosphate synthase small subunit [Thermofilaceae archaeon]
MRAILVLEDGTVVRGRGFGAPSVAVGEVVFTTGMVGYTEALTDPSYLGQILVFTYPLIGNYGVPPYELTDRYGLPLHFESRGIKVEGVVVHEACFEPSHWASRRSIHEWLRDEGIPGIWGVDTRRITQRIRERGVMMGALAVYEEGEPSVGELLKLARGTDYGSLKLAERVSVREPVKLESGRGRGVVALYDCGVKASIVRALLTRGYDVALLPYGTSAERVLDLNPVGVVFSNGPGNPSLYGEAIECAKALIEYGYPMLGICLGHQVISLARGARIFKLRYGHRGVNKPAVDLRTGRCYMTSQNHGYAVERESLAETGLEPWFINADDETIEGVIDEERGVLCVQFHPEASPGPNDTSWVFDLFSKIVEDRKRGIKRV